MNRRHLIGLAHAALFLVVFMLGFMLGLKHAGADALDQEFARHVETETKKLFRLERRCVLAGPYFGPQCGNFLVRRKAS